MMGNSPTAAPWALGRREFFYMRARYFFLLAGFLAAVAGCASHPAAESNAAGSGQSGFDPGGQCGGRDDSAIPAPPAGAQFTLHCATFTGPTHVLDAKRMKDDLVRGTGSKQWYIVHSADESDLYYGFYKTFDDPSQAAEYARAQSDRAKVSTLVDENGDPIFSEVGFVPINTPDPPAPGNGICRATPATGRFRSPCTRESVQRKQLAVDAVRGFRQHGVEAYFRHGPSTSEVYIGSWPRDAVAEQEAAAAEGDDPNEPLLVLPDSFAGAENSTVYGPDGRKMKVVVPKLQILDPSLKVATEKYPYYYVNGIVMGHRVQMADRTWKTIPWPSYLIQVPHENGDEDNSQAKSDVDQNPATSPRIRAMPCRWCRAWAGCDRETPCGF